MPRSKMRPTQPYYPRRTVLLIGPHKLRVLLSPEDADLVRLHWYMSGDNYAVRRERTPDGRSRAVYLHRVVAQRILGDLAAPRRVQFNNKCRLDCRRDNLKIIRK